MTDGRQANGHSRLLSPDAAAVYLGLGSRWAVYRLVASGQLRAIKLAGKVRIDRTDLDALIEALKHQVPDDHAGARRAIVAGVPACLAPLGPRRDAERRVTTPVTAPRGDA